MGAGAALAAGPSKPVTALPAGDLAEQPVGVAEEERAAAELPEQLMRVGGGACVGAETALAAAPSKPVTAWPAVGPPEQPMGVAEEKRAAAELPEQPLSVGGGA